MESNRVFREGEKAYIIENNLRVTPVHIVRSYGDLYTVALSHQCWITLREGRLFRTQEEAQKKVGIVPVPVREEPAAERGYKSPYQYDNSRSPYGI